MSHFSRDEKGARSGLPVEFDSWQAHQNADIQEYRSILAKAISLGWHVAVNPQGVTLEEYLSAGMSQSRKVQIRAFPSSDLEVFRQVYLEQSYAPLVAIAREVLSPGSRPIIVDGGANVGFASIWLHDALQPDELIAVECDGENFAILQANISANLRTGVQCVFGALWSNDHWLGVERDFRDGRSWSRRAQPGPRSDVKGVTLVDLVGHERVIDVLKLDIEGTEFELFEDRDTFDTICNRTRIIGLEIHPDAGDSEALRKKLAEHFCLSEFGELTCGVNTKLC